MKKGIRSLVKAAIAAVLLLLATTAAGAGPLPWQIWDDPRQLPRVRSDSVVLMRSSHCPYGCRFDRHSSDDSRFMRLEDDDEGVIFETAGAGAITRIWMTTGDDQLSLPFDEGVALRIYLDGASEPRVDLPLVELFSGDEPPFVSPLVSDRLGSSGGYFSFIPIPYRQGCRIALVGAGDAKIWFQITHHRLSSDEGVETFTGKEDLTAWRRLMTNPGRDPWAEVEAVEISSGTASLTPGHSVALLDATAPGLLTGLRLSAPSAAWQDLFLRLSFDGRKTVDLSLNDFFAVGRIAEAESSEAAVMRSLLLGRDAQDDLYAYFPMPFFEKATVALQHLGERTAAAVEVGYWLRRSNQAPEPDSGLFGAQLRVEEESKAGVELTLLEIDGAGKWVGLFADLGSVYTSSRLYLEGDERVYLDRALLPSLYGTGVEDFFSSGFYFDQGPFSRALHGMIYHLITPVGEDVTAAYRLMLTDAVTSKRRLRVKLEAGPWGLTPMRARTVAYYYLRDDLMLMAERLAAEEGSTP